MDRLGQLDRWARARRLWLVAGVAPLLLAITWLDGTWVAARFGHGQPAASAVTILYWLVLSRAASKRLRTLMILGLVAATAGEVLFSLGLGMYEYRLRAIPIYVPPGHTILYAAVFMIARFRWVHRHARALTPILFSLGGAYSVVRWQLWNDSYGMLCFGVFCALLVAIRGSRLFFAVMYLLVAYLELAGTAVGAWAWPEILLGRFASVPSANPPSGVAVFYCLFDLSCLALYFGHRFKSFERWVQRTVWRRGSTSARSAWRQPGN